MTDALGGLTVLDFSRGFGGALVSLVLADYGAEVIHVESPAGARSSLAHGSPRRWTGAGRNRFLG